MIDLCSKQDISRLFAAAKASREALAPFRRNRLELIKDYVGSWYSSRGATFKTMVNLIGQTADTYMVVLAYNRPRIRVTTPFRDLWPFALRYQTGINNFIKEMHLEQTLQEITLDAFFSIGVAKVFLADAGQIELEENVWADPGKPYIGRVSLDDFVIDMNAKSTRKVKFAGDYYRVGWEKVRTEPGYNPEVISRLAPTSKYTWEGETAEQISSGYTVDGDEYEPMIDLWDVWLPELNAVATFAREVESEPLIVRPWKGPEGGPYHYLSFADVPDNVMPTAPGQNLKELHDLFNGLFRKQAKQAQRQKTNPVFRPGAAGDAERLKKIGDGEWVNVQDPSAISVITQGGVDPANVAFSIKVGDTFDRMAGNLQAMAGLGPQASTLGQEQLIHQTLSQKQVKLLNRVQSFVAELAGHLGHLMWADALLEVPGTVPVAPGSKIQVDASWTPEMREGDYWQYNFDIEPYSMLYEPPEFKVAKIERAMDKLAAMYPIIQQSGGMIDVQELVNVYADYLQIPELKNVITFATRPMLDRGGAQGQGGGQSAGMPQTSTRNYVRRNVPTGGTPEARSSILQQALLGMAGGTDGNNQQQQTAMMRPAG